MGKQFIRTVLNIGHLAMRLYWFIVRPQTRGVKVLIQHGNLFLFVRLSYAHKSWTFPGGGVNSNETFEEAAIREVKEETGIRLHALTKISEYKTTVEYKHVTVAIFHSSTTIDLFEIDGIEISEACWAPIDSPPIPTARGVIDTKKMYNDFKNGAKV
jgi:8-oxo-dGTP pyrophosphatase MutT (NUDIX family)